MEALRELERKTDRAIRTAEASATLANAVLKLKWLSARAYVQLFFLVVVRVISHTEIEDRRSVDGFTLGAGAHRVLAARFLTGVDY